MFWLLQFLILYTQAYHNFLDKPAIDQKAFDQHLSMNHLTWSDPKMDSQFYVNIDKSRLIHDQKNCTIQFNTQFVLYCEDKSIRSYFLIFGSLKEFLTPSGSKQYKNVYKPFKYKYFLNFAQPIQMFRQYGNYTNYIFVDSKNKKMLTEIDYYGYLDRYSKIRSVNFNAVDRQTKKESNMIAFEDNEEDPQSEYGISSVFQIVDLVRHKDDTHLKIYQRYNTFYFRLHFELSNEMKNMGQVNHSYNYTITSVDYLENVRTQFHLTFAITRARNLQAFTKLMGKQMIYLHVIQYYNPFQNYEIQSPWSQQNQKQYKIQSAIDISITQNCGDLIRASQKLLVVVCKRNGAISIFRIREQVYKQTNNQVWVNTEKPLVSIPGHRDPSGVEMITGNNIGFIEHSNQTLYETYVFITKNAADLKDNQTKPQILAWDIITNDFEKSWEVGLTEQQENLVIELPNIEKFVPPDRSNYGQILNIAAKGDLLLVNYENFDKIQGFQFCGFQSHLNLTTQKCAVNYDGFYHLDLPFPKLGGPTNNYADTNELYEVALEDPNAHYKIITHDQVLYSCHLTPDQLLDMPYVQRSKLRFICGYVSTFEKWKSTTITKVSAMAEFNQFIFSIVVVSISCLCAACSIFIMRWKSDRESPNSLRGQLNIRDADLRQQRKDEIIARILSRVTYITYEKYKEEFAKKYPVNKEEESKEHKEEQKTMSDSPFNISVKHKQLRQITPLSDTKVMPEADPNNRSEILNIVTDILPKALQRDMTEDCCICLDTFTNSQPDTQHIFTNCEHLFHEACLKQWIGSRIGEGRDVNEPDCPSCRQKFQWRE